jgi:glycosyltransferase involved in cell wall biosynthesis
LISRALVSANVDVEIATTDDDGPGRRLAAQPREELEKNQHEPTPLLKCHFFKKQTDFYKIAPSFAPWIFSHAKDYDIVHIHSLFSFTSVTAAYAARLRRVPYIIRPLGVLNRYGITQRRALLKRLSIQCIESGILRGAAAIHFTTPSEQAQAASLGIAMRGTVLPLGVDQARRGNPENLFATHPTLRGAFRILFLARLDPVKNLEGLLGAMSLLQSGPKRLALLIAGTGEQAYETALRTRAAQLGLTSCIHWLGHVSGDAKLDVLSAADLLAMPSFSENFGIAIAEAALAGLPCVVGQGVALAPLIRDTGAGAVVGPDPESIASGIHQLMRADSYLRAATAVRQLAEREFSIHTMTQRLETLYKDVQAGRLPPFS